jgi:hypothetical protein
MARLGRQLTEPFVEVPLEIAGYRLAGDDGRLVFDASMMPEPRRMRAATPVTILDACRRRASPKGAERPGSAGGAGAFFAAKGVTTSSR